MQDEKYQAVWENGLGVWPSLPPFHRHEQVFDILLLVENIHLLNFGHLADVQLRQGRFMRFNFHGLADGYFSFALATVGHLVRNVVGRVLLHHLRLIKLLEGFARGYVLLRFFIGLKFVTVKRHAKVELAHFQLLLI